MSTEDLQKIIARALSESDFRELLYAEPERALAGYELTPEEIEALCGLPRESLEGEAGELEERVSRVWSKPRVLPVRLDG